MDKRRKIVLTYQYNENWIGGTYYIQNLILALNQLPDIKKPILKISCNTIQEFDKLKQLTNYPLLERISLNKKINNLFKFTNRVTNKLFQFLLFNDKYKKFDLLFPYTGQDKVNGKEYLYWIPDFQEHYLPEFFSKEEIMSRSHSHQETVKSAKHIIFSSEDAKSDFNKFYPENKLEQFVLQFAVSHPAPNNKLSLEELRAKYNLPEEYFFCSNQFWIHKNQKIILEAVAALKQQGKNVTVAFSGKEHDFRAPDYFNDLNKMVETLDLKHNIKFLGFIDRQEQLLLMKHSKAVIQPSLFEGWSTVIEDAKALNSKIIASNLKVHYEQMQNYPGKLFFNPIDCHQLAECMSSSISEFSYDYVPLIKQYGEKFMGIVEKICN